MDAPVADLLAALAHQRAGRTQQAEAAYHAMLSAAPGQPEASLHYGLLLLRNGRAGEAAPLLDTAARARPDDAGVRLRLAEARLSLGEPERALDAAEAAGRLGGGAEAEFLRGTALSALGRWAEAEQALRGAVRLRPEHAESHLNLGNALADLDRPEEALEHLARAAVLAPALAEAHASLGCALIAAGRLSEAVAACERAAALKPDMARAHWNIGIASLLAGEFTRGWEQYEWRFRNDPLRRGLPSLPGPVWDGGELHGRTLLVYAEQGLGDAIMFARYLPLLAERGARVLLACAPGLIPLLGGLRGVAGTVPKVAAPPVRDARLGRDARAAVSTFDGPLPAYDLWVDQMSLPRLFGTTRDDIPSSAGYLPPLWRPHPPRARPRAGLVWAGNPAHSNDRRRSLPRAQLAALRAADVEWVSLQAGPRAAEAADLGANDRSAGLTDYAATAEVVRGLDLVVSIDSSVAHLAGALGCPVWVMLPHAPDWRWMLGRPDTPWYASMRLFRQSAPGAWGEVIARILAELRAPQDGPVQAPQTG